jgi:hypothetical protein
MIKHSLPLLSAGGIHSSWSFPEIADTAVANPLVSFLTGAALILPFATLNSLFLIRHSPEDGRLAAAAVPVYAGHTPEVDGDRKNMKTEA